MDGLLGNAISRKAPANKARIEYFLDIINWLSNDQIVHQCQHANKKATVVLIQRADYVNGL